MWRSSEAYWQVSRSRRWQLAATDWPASHGRRVSGMKARRALNQIRRSAVATPEPAASHAPDRYRHIVLPGRVGVLGELSGVFAHELAQPLTSILRNAEAALQIALPEVTVPAEIHQILRDIITDTARAGEMIRRLRSLLTRGEVQCQGVDLNQVIREVLASQKSDLLRLNVSAAAELAEHDSCVLGDCIQLQQVLLNLVMNACEAMSSRPDTDRRLIIATRLGHDSEYIECSVTDSGHGIPAHSLERIFEPRVTTKCNGLGLGLAICRSIIEAHGGRLWAENASGGGAVFRFTAKRVPG